MTNFHFQTAARLTMPKSPFGCISPEEFGYNAHAEVADLIASLHDLRGETKTETYKNICSKLHGWDQITQQASHIDQPLRELWTATIESLVGAALEAYTHTPQRTAPRAANILNFQSHSAGAGRRRAAASPLLKSADIIDLQMIRSAGRPVWGRQGNGISFKRPAP